MAAPERHGVKGNANARTRASAFLGTGFRSVRHRAPTAWFALLALAAALALTMPAHAQTETEFVSNTGQTARTTGLTGNRYAQSFTTGSEENGYILSGIEMVMKTGGGFGRARMWLHEEASGLPGTRVTAMTQPGSWPLNTPLRFTAPANTLLKQDTTYFIVIHPTNGGGLGTTTSSAEDSVGFGFGFGFCSELRRSLRSWSAIFKTDALTAPCARCGYRAGADIRRRPRCLPNADSFHPPSPGNPEPPGDLGP